jgi:hypothetical protein
VWRLSSIQLVLMLLFHLLQTMLLVVEWAWVQEQGQWLPNYQKTKTKQNKKVK